MRVRRLALLLACLAGAGVSLADEHPNARAGLCQSAASPQVATARAGLKASPDSLAARIKLADAFIEATCYDEAVHTLEDGQAIHPRNSELQAKLRNTRSLVSEQSYFEGKEQAEQAARVSRNLLRCTRLGDVSACDEALKLKPNDAEMLLAKGDALLKASKPADAEFAYRRAQQAAPGNPRVTSQLAAAQSQRQAALSQCQTGSGEGALQSCQAALLPGAPDEFAIQSRMGLLYQQLNKPVPALAAYIAADTLKPGDHAVALGLVELTAARGSALRTLNRGKGAPSLPAVREPPQVQVRLYSNLTEPTRSH